MSLLSKDKSIALYAALVSFGTYVFIFGFRKSFTVCTFDGLSFGPIAFKTALVISQMLGYLLAKFYGIKFISGLQKVNRYKIIFLLTGISWLAWLLFAVVPAPYNVMFLFLNGFPLGMLWGVVFSYVEGRKSTDFIGAALAVSFIFSSGWVKSVGAWLMEQYHITEFWVPFFTGLVFAVPLIICVYGLEKVPPPSAEDEALRTKRIPMTALDRKQLIKQYLPGIIAFVAIYLFATIFRDIRDNFSADMWKEMGYGSKPAIFTQTEIPITIFILVIIGAVVLIKNSFKVQGAKVLLLGVTFKENCPDIRNSQAFEIYTALKKIGVEVFAFDPFANAKEVFDNHQINLVTSLETYDAIVLTVAHDFFKSLNYTSLKSSANSVIYDTKAILDKSIVTARL